MLPPAELTMTTVAETLGVTRKALSYYVADRSELVGLVVLEKFEAELNQVEFPAEGDWRHLLNAYAHAIRDGIIEVGELAAHYPVSHLAAPAALGIAERVLAALVTAGFDIDAAGKALTAVNDAASDAARQVLVLDDDGVHPMVPATLEVLESAPAAEWPLLRRVASARRAESQVDEQFAFILSVLIAGLEKILR